MKRVRWAGYLCVALFLTATTPAMGQRMRFASPASDNSITVPTPVASGAVSSSVAETTTAPSAGASVAIPASARTMAAGPVTPPPARLAQNVAPPPSNWNLSPPPTAPPIMAAPQDPWRPANPPALVDVTPPLVPAKPVVDDHTWTIFGEFLFLQPRSAEIGYAIPVNGASGVQNGPTAMLNPDYSPGFRVGFSRALSSSADLGGAFTWFESAKSGGISVAAPDALVAFVFRPGTPAATALFLDATANERITYNLVDLDYRGLFVCGDCYRSNFLIGARFANLDQTFHSQFSNTVMTETLDTSINFSGAGIRVGLEGERRGQNSGLLVYGRGVASFIGGSFHGSYVQNDSVLGTVANSDWTAKRVVPILDVEVGCGWVSPAGRFRVSGGYLFSAWLNAMKTSEFIHAAQTGNFGGMSDTLTFDGLVARTEFRF